MIELSNSTKKAMDRLKKAGKTSEQPLIRQKKYPEWICLDCGLKYCNRTNLHSKATFHFNKCGCCGSDNIPCTEPRDFGHLKSWPLSKQQDPDPIPQVIGDLVEKVIDNFDFEKVHRVMVQMDWKWFGLNEGMAVPSVQRLRSKARKYLEYLVSSDCECITSGGLCARKYIDPEYSENNGLELSFVLTKSESCLGDFE